MSYYDYIAGRTIAAESYPFYGLIQAAMRRADTENLEKLKLAFPSTYEELMQRYDAPGGLLEEEVLHDNYQTYPQN